MGGNHSSRRGPATLEGTDRRLTEDLLIRNHDFQWGYDVEVEVRDEDGPVHEARYYLQSGGTRSEGALLPAGVYHVRVVLDNDRTGSARCHVDDAGDAGILVELGNGAVSVHDGLYR